MPSPYEGVEPELWLEVTKHLIKNHPLQADDIVDVVRTAWSAIFESKLAGKFRIGHEIQPKPQIMGFLLHELIPLELQSRFPNLWRGDKQKNDKDLVYIPDVNYSVELKTSSHTSQIFGNRSYAQEQLGQGKSKDGYYLTVNFGKFVGNGNPDISLIRFGWLDHTDWIAQKAATGQQARIAPLSDKRKLLRLYSNID